MNIGRTEARNSRGGKKKNQRRLRVKYFAQSRVTLRKTGKNSNIRFMVESVSDHMKTLGKRNRKRGDNEKSGKGLH